MCNSFKSYDTPKTQTFILIMAVLLMRGQRLRCSVIKSSTPKHRNREEHRSSAPLAQCSVLITSDSLMFSFKSARQPLLAPFTSLSILGLVIHIQKSRMQKAFPRRTGKKKPGDHQLPACLWSGWHLQCFHRSKSTALRVNISCVFYIRQRMLFS